MMAGATRPRVRLFGTALWRWCAALALLEGLLAGWLPGAGVARAANDSTFPQPTDAATRRFVIQALWQAMQATFGQDRVP